MPKTIQQISADSPYQDLDTNVLDLIDYVGATELRTNFQYRSIYDTVYRLCVAIGDNNLTNGIPYHDDIEDTVRLIILNLLDSDGGPWYNQGQYDGLDPTIWLDFSNDRYSYLGVEKPITDILTFTRAGPASFIDSAGTMQQAASGVLRRNWNPATLECEGILIEESRTNLFLNSSIGATQGITVTAQAYTVSFYGTGTITFSGAYTGSLVGSGDFPTRSTLTFTPSAGTVTCTITGDVQYVNFEAGSFATSWISTKGATVTRPADILLGNNSNVIPFSAYYSTTSTISAKFVPKTGLNNKNVVSISDGTNNNRLLVRPAGSGQTGGAGFINSGGVTQYTETNIGLNQLNVMNSCALAFAANDIQFYYNGTAGAADTSATLMVSPTIMRIGAGPTTNELMNGCVSEVRIYPSRLGNTSLLALSNLGDVISANFFGDSITDGMNATTEANKWRSIVANTLGYFGANKGISGSPLQNSNLTSTGLPSVNNGRDRYLSALCGTSKAKKVFILYGVNDERFSATDLNFTQPLFSSDLEEVIVGLLANGYAGSDITIGTIPLFSSLFNSTFHTNANASIRALAVTYGLKYADVYQAMVDNGGSSLVDTDSIHPTDAGHAVIAAAFLAADFVS